MVGKKRRGLSPEARKRGVLASIRSPKTPPHLKRGLREYAKKRGWLR